MKLFYVTDQEGVRVAEGARLSTGFTAVSWYSNDGKWGGKRNQTWRSFDDFRCTYYPDFGIEWVRSVL